MRIIGLTGGIASGKSTVSDMLRNLGAYLIDTDQLARQVVTPGQAAWEDIVKVFGESILLADGTIDRKRLGDIVFNDDRLRQTLEQIIHPQIQTAVEREIAAAALAGREIVIIDVPLLYEVGWRTMVDEVWLVYVEELVQQRRLMQRNHYSEEEARIRMAAQMSLREKKKYADVLIDNNGDLNDTYKQIVENWERVTKETSNILLD